MNRMQMLLSSSITKEDLWLRGENGLTLGVTVVVLLVALYISVRVARKHKIFEEDLTSNTN